MKEKAAEVNVPAISQSSIIRHQFFGTGTILEVQDATIKVSFPSVCEKILGLDWCRKNCKFE